MKKDKERYLYALIICACVFISLGIYSYWRRREKEIKNQKKILEQTIEKQRQNNLRIKELKIGNISRAIRKNLTAGGYK